MFRQWTCCVCDGEGIFMVDDTTGKLALRKDPDGNVNTFSCVTCGKKYCGQPNCAGREDRRKCTGCKGFECWECSDKSSWNCPYCCKFSPHCLKCQGGAKVRKGVIYVAFQFVINMQRNVIHVVYRFAVFMTSMLISVPSVTRDCVLIVMAVEMSWNGVRVAKTNL